MSVFYAVYGENGIGVCNNYYKVQESLSYLKRGNCKKILSFTDALEHAEEMFNELNPADHIFIRDYGDFPLNWVVYKKELTAGNYGRRKNYE